MKRYIHSSHDEDLRLEVTDQSDDEMWIDIMLGDQVSLNMMGTVMSNELTSNLSTETAE